MGVGCLPKWNQEECTQIDHNLHQMVAYNNYYKTFRPKRGHAWSLMKDGLLSEVLDWENFGVFNRLDCKTVCIFVYSSMREQSNKRSGTRLKTESETRALHVHKTLMPPFTDLPISLLILRKKPDCFAVY